MGMVFKNIEYMNEGCFENLSGTSVPKSIGRGPPGINIITPLGNTNQRMGVHGPLNISEVGSSA
jgi:hypothetical protein